MKWLIWIFKTCSVISFLFIVIPGDEVLLPMWMVIGAGMMGLSGIKMMVVSLVIFLAMIVILTTGISSSKKNILLILCLVLLYVPVLYSLTSVFTHDLYISNLTYSLFGLFSVCTIIMLTTGFISKKSDYWRI